MAQLFDREYNERHKMDIEEQLKFIGLIGGSWEGIRIIISQIEEAIKPYPVLTQVEFMKPLKMMIVEMLNDAQDVNNTFLNNYKGAETITINPPNGTKQ